MTDLQVSPRQRAVDFMLEFDDSDPISLMVAFARFESDRALEKAAATVDPDGDICSLQEEAWRRWSRDKIRAMIEKEKGSGS